MVTSCERWCVRVWECVYLHAHFSVSWRSVWVLKAIWLSDMNLHFPFLLLINVFQPDVLCGYTNSTAADSRLHSSRFNTHFIDVLVLIQTRIASMNLDWRLSKPQPQTLEISFYLKYEKKKSNQSRRKCYWHHKRIFNMQKQPRRPVQHSSGHNIIITWWWLL